MTGPGRVDAFQLERPIGRGGAAEVWAARHVATGHAVAIKFLSEVAAARHAAFELELSVLAGLTHPHIVTLLDYGRLESDTPAARAGTPWLAMELGQGTSRTAFQRLSWGDTVELVRHVLDALAHAHSLGFLHRDVKPGNLLHVDVPTRRWKLADFGIAQALAESTTHRGATLSYAPPEQTGRSDEQGPWTDLYGLGMTLWRLVTGERPSLQSTEAGVVHRLPAFRPRWAVPAGLEDWLRWLTQAQVAHRPQRCAEARRAFEAVVAGRLATTGLPRHVPRPAAPAVGWMQGVGLRLFPLRRVHFVGRHGERDTLWRHLLRVEAQGRAASVTVAGPRGAGTSRLVRWLARTAHQQGAHAVVLQGEHPSRMLMDVVGTSSPARVRAWARSHDLHELDIDQLLALGARDTPDRPSLLALLDAASEERPVVLVIDDAATWSRALADQVLDRLPHRPILVVRTDVADAADIELGPLPAGEMELLLQQTLPLAPRFLSAVREHAQGLPGRPLAWLRGAARRGDLEHTPHGIAPRDGAAEPSHAPPTVDLDRWLPALGTDERSMLDLLTVLGPSIERTWLAGLPATALDPVVRRLVVHGHVEATPARLRFRDPAVHDALLERVREPRTTHGLAADQLEHTAGPLHRRAWHLFLAERWDAAFWPLIFGSDELRLSGHPQTRLTTAARRCLDTLQVPEADPRRVVERRQMGLVIRALGHPGQALEPLGEAVARARAHGHAKELAVSLTGLAAARAASGDVDVEPLYDEAEAVAPDPEIAAKVEVSRCQFLATGLGRFDRARDKLAPCVHLLSGPEAVDAHVILCRAAIVEGALDRAHELAMAARAADVQRSSRPGVMNTLFVLGEIDFLRGDTAAARSHFEEARRLACHADANDVAVAEVNLALVHSAEGAWAEAMDALHRCDVLVTRTGWTGLSIQGRTLSLLPLAALGDWPAFDDALARARGAPLPMASWEAAWATNRALYHVDDEGRARALHAMARHAEAGLAQGLLGALRAR